MKILIVDDSKATQTIVRRVVEQLPYSSITTTSAENGIKGLEIIRAWEPDLIILDWYMPEMTGIEMLQTLESEKINIPVGFITTETDQAKKQEAFDHGAVFFTQKPFTAGELQSAIIPIIENYINQKSIIEEDTAELSSYSTKEITQLVNLIKKSSGDSVSIDAIETSDFENDQFPCILGLLETCTGNEISASILFDHNASCIIEKALTHSNRLINNINNKTIDKNTLTQCKLLTHNINQAILKGGQKDKLQLRSLSVIDDNIEVVENLMKKDWKKRIDLSVNCDDVIKGVITLSSA